MKKLTTALTALLICAVLSACAPQTNPAAAMDPSATPISAPTAQPASSATPAMTPDVSYATGPATPTPSGAIQAATPTNTPAGTNDSLTVTLDNNNTSLTLARGQRFLLQLGETYDWNLVIADQSVVSRVKGVLVVRGAQGLFEGLNPGQTEVSAQGDPVCRSQKPACAMPSILFRLTVLVK